MMHRLIASSNCTFMELKCVLRGGLEWTEGSNCTFMELK